ncbi:MULTISPECIES: amidase [Nocardia]|uniref:amidase n=1 Tax=Nocardia aurea TaxID=2144174 RepID=A0ABV3G2H0_9NOCA|nr:MULTISPECIES: amidase family protein [Nocardia]
MSYTARTTSAKTAAEHDRDEAGEILRSTGTAGTTGTDTTADRDHGSLDEMRRPGNAASKQTVSDRESRALTGVAPITVDAAKSAPRAVHALDVRTATAVAAHVREGTLTPTDAVEAALARITAENSKTNALTLIRADAACAEAAAVEQRDDLDVLPLAGVPVAVEHGLPVTGVTMSRGSEATDRSPATADHPVVRRLRAAGAVVVGTSAISEMGLWPMSDDADSATRNPWNLERGAGGAAAAVAAGLVPVAHGIDGTGSVRIAAACCGVFGFKPGRYTVPADIGVDGWGGLAENGVLATTVDDAALMLSVMAGRPDLAEPDTPGRLRIGLALAPPHRFFRVDRQWAQAARSAAETAERAGHIVDTVTVPYGAALPAVLLRWLTAELPGVERLPRPERLQPRTRRHLAFGRLVDRLRLVRPAQIDRIEARLLELFDNYDVVITPTLAAPPPRARIRGARGWLANILTAARLSPFTPVWNLVGWPAASIPMGTHSRTNTPVAAQLAGPPGSESTLLGLAAQLEQHRPWRRIAVR